MPPPVSPTPAPPTPAPAPTPPTPPTPAPPPGQASLALATCDATDPRQQWVFSGEDGGEPGRLSAASNTSACLDARAGPRPPVRLGACAVGSQDNHTLWSWSSAAGRFGSVARLGCLVSAHGRLCNMCLDANKREFGSGVDLFDCKDGDGNQGWAYDEAQGAGLVRHKARGLCLAVL